MNENAIKTGENGADLWGHEVPEHDTNSTDLSRPGEWQGGEEKPELLVTVIIKQAGFYGSQCQFAVEVNVNSHLFRAVDTERKGGKDPTELLLDSLAAAVRSAILPLVS